MRKELLSFLDQLGVNKDVEGRFLQWCEDEENHDHHNNVISQILESNFIAFDGEATCYTEHLLSTGFLPSSPIFAFLSLQNDPHLSLRNHLDTFLGLFCSPDRPTSNVEFPYRDDCRNESFQFGRVTPVGAANYRDGNQSML